MWGKPSKSSGRRGKGLGKQGNPGIIKKVYRRGGEETVSHKKQEACIPKGRSSDPGHGRSGFKKKKTKRGLRGKNVKLKRKLNKPSD